MLAAFKAFLEDPAHFHHELLQKASKILSHPIDLIQQTQDFFIQILQDDRRSEKQKLFEFFKEVFPSASLKTEDLTEAWMANLFQPPIFLETSSRTISLDVFKSTDLRAFAASSFREDYKRGGLNLFFNERALPPPENCVGTFLKTTGAAGIAPDFAWALLALFSQTEYGVFNIAQRQSFASTAALGVCLLGSTKYDVPKAFAVNTPNQVCLSFWKELISPGGNLFLSATVKFDISIENDNGKICVNIVPQLYVWDPTLRLKLQPAPMTPPSSSQLSQVAQMASSAGSTLRSAARRALAALSFLSPQRSKNPTSRQLFSGDSSPQKRRNPTRAPGQ